jgi:hypothetical protein
LIQPAKPHRCWCCNAGRPSPRGGGGGGDERAVRAHRRERLRDGRARGHVALRQAVAVAGMQRLRLGDERGGGEYRARVASQPLAVLAQDVM